MDRVLCLKFCQHADLCTMLLNTYSSDLVYVESRDPLWGGNGPGAGMNESSKSLVRLRSEEV
jgi:predicted NAD-dependent protein-ADP-ribosyltransferase YbiA (DUF1768 family)